METYLFSRLEKKSVTEISLWFVAFQDVINIFGISMPVKTGFTFFNLLKWNLNKEQWVENIIKRENVYNVKKKKQNYYVA